MSLLPLHDEIAYGPVRSRRLGRSLGLNVFPPGRKICNFNCAYCQYGWTRTDAQAVEPELWPTPAAVAGAARRALQELVDAGGRVDRITLAGNGEPTLHPEIGEIVERIRVVRDDVLPSARIAILSNGGTLDRPAVVAALLRLDDACLKLDAVDPVVMRRLNHPRGTLPTPDLLRVVPRVTIQSLFTRDPRARIDNTTTGAVEAWLGALRIIRPMAVHLYTIDREPAWSALQRVPRPELEAIARRVRAARIPARVF
jgi:wyosine [tRNA(Phe)-imidazoG37] synthetase (radical SAM superfamily)